MPTELVSAIRSLKSTPAPVAAAILTLALAIGTNAGMVGLVRRALLNPPEQVSDPDRVVTLGFEHGEGDARELMTVTSYVTYAEDEGDQENPLSFRKRIPH